MADLLSKYPATSSVALAITLASLASDTNLLAGRESDAQDNRSNGDIDALLGGKITTGTSPTANRVIEVWAYANISSSIGTPAYVDTIAGSNANRTLTSANVKQPMLRLVAQIVIDSTSDRTYFFAPVSIASLFGFMPKFWGAFVVHNCGVALNATGGNHALTYERCQYQN